MKSIVESPGMFSELNNSQKLQNRFKRNKIYLLKNKYSSDLATYVTSITSLIQLHSQLQPVADDDNNILQKLTQKLQAEIDKTASLTTENDETRQKIEVMKQTFKVVDKKTVLLRNKIYTSKKATNKRVQGSLLETQKREKKTNEEINRINFIVHSNSRKHISHCEIPTDHVTRAHSTFYGAENINPHLPHLPKLS